MLVVKLCGLGGMRVCMSSRRRVFVVPFHDRWLSLQLVRPDEGIVDDFELVDVVVVQEADGNIVSRSQ
jgi:hypothetical protein